MFILEDEKKDEKKARTLIKVIGVGGGGGNAVSRMFNTSNGNFLEFIVANTDLQVLEQSPVLCKIQIGAKLTNGLGSGSIADIGERAAQEDKEAIRDALYGADMIFITAGMGGGTGTGAAPVIAEIAKDIGALTVAVVTKPFLFEGMRRMRQAEEGIEKLVDVVDALITIPNQRLLSTTDKNLSISSAFKMADEVLNQGIQGITEMIAVPGLVNVDFADVKTIMNLKGKALMGIGFGEGDDRAKKAAKEAINSPLLEETSIDGATGILINITGGDDLTLSEVDESCNVIIEKADKDVNCIFGAVIDKSLGGRIKITVIATGFGKKHEAVSVIKQEMKQDVQSHYSILENLEIPTFLRRSH